ncbi:MAG: glycosyltransferase family 4 protein [Candidatus Bathyarchaeales archaeon]
MKEKMEMRVFSVFFHPSTSVTAVGGAERRFCETVKFFARKNVQMVVLEPNSSLLKKNCGICKVYELSRLFSSAKSWLAVYLDWILWTFFACFRAAALVHREACQIIFSPNNTTPNLIPAYFAHIATRRPLCIITHHIDTPSENSQLTFKNVFSTYRKIGYSTFTSMMKSIAFLAMATMLKKADACIAVSNFTARTLVRLGVKEERISLSGNAVDTQFITQPDPQENKQFDAVFVGRIAKEKGIFDLLHVWREVLRKNNSARLLVIGSGPETQKVKDFIKNSGLQNNVIVCGRVDDERLYHLMKASRIFVFPSRFEGWGLSIAEAMACGLPVVCYDIPALREVFGRCESVFLIPTGDVRRFSDVVLRILNRRKKEYERLAKISRNYTSHFSWESVAMEDLRAIKNMYVRL